MTTETTFEDANRRYHTAHIAFAQIDAKVIDASATLEELHEKHAAAANELNAAREALVKARSPVRPAPNPETQLVGMNLRSDGQFDEGLAAADTLELSGVTTAEGARAVRDAYHGRNGGSDFPQVSVDLSQLDV